MKNSYLLTMFFALPFAIAALFKYSDWLGWPALLVLGMYWLGVCIKIKEEK